VNRVRPLVAATALVFTALALQPRTVGAQLQRLGTIDFPTSGAPAAQQAFVRGVLFMHSFEYDAASRSFREAQRLDPGFAMAYWGEAMSLNHPVWNQQDREGARAVLVHLGPTPADRRAKAPTDREKEYLDAVEILYGDGTKPARDTAYSMAMQALADRYPDDLEAQAFYALSLLGLNQGVRDVPTYMRAAAVAQAVFRKNPDHPGAAHYIIHAFDDPVHAPLGLYAAQAYIGIAPGAAHAQHMTTHIFVAMGMWDDVVSQNEVAAGPDRARWLPGHYTRWLTYGYLQQGRYADARSLIQTLATNAGPTPRGRQGAMLDNLRARYVIETEQWDAPEALALSDADDVPGEDGYEYVRFVDGLAAAHRGDRAAAERSLEMLASETGTAGSNVQPGATGAVAVPVILAKMLRAQLRLEAGADDEAVALLREATALEDAMPFEFGPPAVVKPSHEMFGEVLMRLDRPAEAVLEFQRALGLAPGRARSLLGLARAARAASETATSDRAYDQLLAVWHRADADVPALGEVRSEAGDSR